MMVHPGIGKAVRDRARDRSKGACHHARLEHPEFRAHLVSCVQLRRVAAAVV